MTKSISTIMTAVVTAGLVLCFQSAAFASSEINKKSIKCHSEKTLSDGAIFEYSAELIPGALPQLKVAIYPKDGVLDRYAEYLDVVSFAVDAKSGDLAVRSVLTGGLESATITVLNGVSYDGDIQLLKGVLDLEKEVTDRSGFAYIRKNQFILGCEK